MRQNVWPVVRIPRPSGRAVVLLVALLLTGAAAEEPTHRYLSLGDSFTAGSGASVAESFPDRLVARWRRAGVEVKHLNPAVNGYTTTDLIDDELPLLATFKPTVVTVAIGANDLVRGSDEKRYRSQLKRILKAIIDAGVKPASIYALPQPAWSAAPVAEAFGDRAVLQKKIERFNAVLKEEVSAVGGRYVDLWPLMLKNAKDLSDDGLHPSAQAYDAWAAELHKQIKLK